MYSMYECVHYVEQYDGYINLFGKRKKGFLFTTLCINCLVVGFFHHIIQYHTRDKNSYAKSTDNAFADV